MAETLYNKLQHEKMFYNRQVCVFCPTNKDSMAFEQYLKSIGYKWNSGSELCGHAHYRNQFKYYIQSCHRDGKYICIDDRNVFNVDLATFIAKE